jgi:hypothetical protein
MAWRGEIFRIKTPLADKGDYSIGNNRNAEQEHS